MAIKAKKVKRVVDEMAKFDKGEIEFLFETIKEAIEWQQTRGARSGRVAWQFILFLAGKYEVNL